MGQANRQLTRIHRRAREGFIPLYVEPTRNVTLILQRVTAISASEKLPRQLM